jgi:hypothetical protein
VWSLLSVPNRSFNRPHTPFYPLMYRRSEPLTRRMSAPISPMLAAPQSPNAFGESNVNNSFHCVRAERHAAVQRRDAHLYRQRKARAVLESQERRYRGFGVDAVAPLEPSVAARLTPPPPSSRRLSTAAHSDFAPSLLQQASSAEFRSPRLRGGSPSPADLSPDVSGAYIAIESDSPQLQHSRGEYENEFGSIAACEAAERAAMLAAFIDAVEASRRGYVERVELYERCRCLKRATRRIEQMHRQNIIDTAAVRGAAVRATGPPVPKLDFTFLNVSRGIGKPSTRDARSASGKASVFAGDSANTRRSASAEQRASCLPCVVM